MQCVIGQYGAHEFLDHTSTAGENAYNIAMESAQDYDDLTRGSGAADLNDLKATKSTRVTIPDTWSLARALLQSYRVILMTLLGDDHQVVRAYSTFLRGVINRENFYLGRLQKADAKLGAARFVRYVQLVFRAWPQETWGSVNLTTARAVANPALNDALLKMSIGDLSWLPGLPAQYSQPVPERRAGAGAPAGASTTQSPMGIRTTHLSVRIKTIPTLLLPSLSTRRVSKKLYEAVSSSTALIASRSSHLRSKPARFALVALPPSSLPMSTPIPSSSWVAGNPTPCSSTCTLPLTRTSNGSLIPCSKPAQPPSVRD